MGQLRFPKGSCEQVSEHFQALEFDCPCSNLECRETVVDEDHLARLEKMRAILGVPLHVSLGGGCRCHRYQDELRARGHETSFKISTHEQAIASDVSTGHHSGLELEGAARQAGFRAVGVGFAWVHVDGRRDGDRRWLYGAGPERP